MHRKSWKAKGTHDVPGEHCWIIVLLLATGRAGASVPYTVCSGKSHGGDNYERGTIGYGPMSNLKSKLENQQFFGETGLVAPNELRFAVPLRSITPDALALADCDIWFSGNNTGWSDGERLALSDWLHSSEAHFVIGSCNSLGHGEVCQAMGLPAEDFGTPLEAKTIQLSTMRSGSNNPLRCGPRHHLESHLARTMKIRRSIGYFALTIFCVDTVAAAPLMSRLEALLQRL